jgi:transposase
MLPRHAISDADWDRIKHLLPGQPGQHGGVARDNRLFIDAILYVARTGIPWEDLPERFGKHNTVWRRFDRWAKKGRWDPILVALREPDLDMLILDSTAVRAHPCAAGAKKSGTGPGARRNKHSAAAGVDLEPRFMGVSTVLAIPSSCS